MGVLRSPTSAAAGREARSPAASARSAESSDQRPSVAETTGISWCDATFNPWVGCSKVSPGCAHCYAETLVTGSGPRQLNRPGTWGADGIRERTSASTWAKPKRWERLAREGLLPDGQQNQDGHRPRVFCASLADVFEARPELDEWRLELFELIAATPNLDWLLLTKRPDVASYWLRSWWETEPHGVRSTNAGQLDLSTGNVIVPEVVQWEAMGQEWTSRDGLGWGCVPNLWIGTSIENSRHTWRANLLREIPAAVRFISAEPLLGSLYRGDWRIRVGGRGHEPVTMVAAGHATLDLTGIDWVIVGGESGGRDARPMHPDWAREIRDAVLARAIPEGGLAHGEHPYDYGYERPAFHFKQWGSWVPDGRGEVCLSDDGTRYDKDDHYICAPNESDGTWMRYAGATPKAGGKLLDGDEWCEFPDGSMVATPP